MTERVLAFAAHDPGGAKVLLPVIEAASEEDMPIRLLAKGPAIDIWTEAGFRLKTTLGDADCLVTGTSISSDFEQTLWAEAKAREIPTLAVIEAWMNYRRRFEIEASGQLVLPDVIALPDGNALDAVAAEGWCDRPLHAVGQPHLELTAETIREARADHGRGQPPLVVFFSEPLSTDHPGPGHPGFDEHSTLPHLMAGLSAAGPCRLVIQPHPREPADKWPNALASHGPVEGVMASLSANSTDELLAEADLVVGMISMALVEAALGGCPVVSLQIGRKAVINPLLDRISAIRQVITGSEVPAALAAALLDRQPSVATIDGLPQQSADRLLRLARSLSKAKQKPPEHG